ncbi:BnaC05g44480D [Brassica napus]|uniref:BnaC05g44480D protein n=1 Tax=Brassica napus TaxID=3708 RepID=A0A078GRL4_BRANA|nr:BnaC05g44480D [Brassica napus]
MDQTELSRIFQILGADDRED